MNGYGYAGSILRVDLSTGKTTTVPTEPYARRFLGGRGIAAKVCWDEVPPETKYDDEGNRFIIALGPMAGVPALGGSRWGAYGKSPLTEPQKFNYGNLGGHFGAELKFAGYDGIIVEGKADKPVLLFIEDGSAEIHDAADLRGVGAIKTREMLKERLGSHVKVAAIGPAGENLVATAIVLADGDASCSGGMGAVMGAKNLKAIAVRGTSRKVKVARPEELRDLARLIREMGRGNVKVWGLDFMAQGPKTKKAPCYGCMGHCLRVNYTADNGATGKFMCQSRFFYLINSWAYHGGDNDVPFLANKLCDDYGLDTWTLQQTLDWLNRCRQGGLITDEETGLPFDRVGSLEFIEELVRMISLRRGFGEILAGGAERAALKRGGDSASHIKPQDPYEPRLYLTNALLFPFEPREPIQQIHEVGLTLAQWASWAKGVEGAHISSEVLKKIAAAFWGGEEAADLTTYNGKALAAKLIQDRQYAKECAIVCDWMYPVIDNPSSEDHVGDPTLERRILSAVTGDDMDDKGLSIIGERVFNLQRALLLRDGHRPVEDDLLPEEWHKEPLSGHVADPDCLAPGSDGRAVSRKGAMVEMKDYTKMREEYYSLRGWSSTGLQTRETLKDLNLEDIIDEMASLELMAGEG